MDTKTFGRANLAFGFVLFLFNFFYIFLARHISFSPDWKVFLTKMLGAMAIDSSQVFYNFNPYLGTYFMLFNSFYLVGWLTITVIPMLWLIMERKNNSAFPSIFLDDFLEKSSKYYSLNFKVALFGPVLAFLFFFCLLAVFAGPDASAKITFSSIDSFAQELSKFYSR